MRLQLFNKEPDKAVSVQFYVSEKLLKAFDQAARKAGYETRSEALRALMREFIKQRH